MGFEDLLPPVLMEIRAKFGDLHSELAKVGSELDEAANRGEIANTKMGRAFDKTAAYGQTLTKGVIGLAGVVGGFAVDAATSAEVVDAKLRTAIVNAGGSMEDMEPKITKLDSSMRGMGFTNDQTNTSLATLTTALKDPEKAMGAMGVATDLARAKNIDLNTASLLVAKAMEGQTRPLKALGIDLPIAAGNALAVKNAQTALATAQQKVNDVLAKYPDAANAASKGHAQYQAATEAVQKAQTKLSDAQSAGGQILDELKSRVAGAGDAYGKTLRGQLDSAKAGVENMGESLGKILIPLINDAIQAGVKIMDFLQGHTWILYLIGSIFGVVMAAGVAKWVKSIYDGALELGSKLSEMLGKVSGWASNMIAQHTKVSDAAKVSADEQVVAQETVQAAEEETAVVSRTAGEAIEVGLGPIGLVIAAITTAVMLLQGHWKDVWDAIKAIASAAWNDVIKPVWESLLGGIDQVKAGIHQLGQWWNDAMTWIRNVQHAAYEDVKAVFDWLYANAIEPVKQGIHQLGQWWNDAWTWVKGATHDAVSFVMGILGPLISFIQNVIGWFSSLGSKIDDTVSKAQNSQNWFTRLGGTIGSWMGFGGSHLDGGWIPGSPGQAMPTLMHGSEYVLSVAMLQGRQAIDPKVLAAIGASSDPSAAALMGGTPPAAVGGGVTVLAQTNASPSQIASSVGWELRKRAS